MPVQNTINIHLVPMTNNKIVMDQSVIIENGKIKKNPLKDIKNIKEKYGVMAAGKWYTEEQLQQMISLDVQQ